VGCYAWRSSRTLATRCSAGKFGHSRHDRRIRCSDEAIEYQAELIVDLTLRRQSDGTVLWEASGLQEIEEYAVQVDIVVPSTSQFQQGTLNLETCSS